MRKLSICFVSQEYPEETGWGGIGTYTYEMAHGLARRGHRVLVLSRALATERSYSETDGVQVYRILPRLNPNRLPMVWRLNQIWEGYHLAVALQLRQLVKEYKIDLIEAPTLSGETAIFRILEKQTPIILRLHSFTPLEVTMSGEEWTRSLKTAYAWERMAVRQTNYFTAPTRRIVCDNAALIGDRNVHVIPNPLDLRRFDCDMPSDESLGVLFAGRLDWRKGIRELVQAMLLVWQEIPDLPLTIVGRERGAHADAQNSVSAWMRQKLSSAPPGMVRWIDWQPRDKMPALYARAAIGVFPSHWEAFGYVYVETMASGKPVIAARAGGPEEIIRDGETGFLVPPQDPHVLAQAILKLAREKEMRREMGQRARQEVSARFDLPVVVDQMQALYASIL